VLEPFSLLKGLASQDNLKHKTFVAFFVQLNEIIGIHVYLNKEVIIKGHFIEGYPVDGGPQYIVVEEIE
jgi:hypothetical protein